MHRSLDDGTDLPEEESDGESDGSQSSRYQSDDGFIVASDEEDAVRGVGGRRVLGRRAAGALDGSHEPRGGAGGRRLAFLLERARRPPARRTTRRTGKKRRSLLEGSGLGDLTAGGGRGRGRTCRRRHGVPGRGRTSSGASPRACPSASLGRRLRGKLHHISPVLAPIYCRIRLPTRTSAECAG